MTKSSKTWQPRDVHRAGRPIPCRQVLTRLPGRVLTFLHAAATRPEIRLLLRDAGYSASDHEEGSRLLMAVTAYAPSVGTAVEHDGLVNQAQREIDDWVRVHLPRFRCIIEHHHPEALDLFETSEASTPLEALPALAIWLGRLRALAAQRTHLSKRLFETLARRGLDAAERARLEGQVRQAQSAPEVGDALVGRDARLDELMALLAWYRDWAMTAKFQVQSRRHLIALGLAERGRRGAVEGELEWEVFDEPSETGGRHTEPPEASERQAQAQGDSRRGAGT